MDIRLYVEEAGEGFPLILLHGNGGSGKTFAAQMEGFGRCFHVHAIDTRGHGRSPRGTAPFTLVQFSEDLADFMEERGIEKAHVLGFSDGGNIAMIFAMNHPDKVEKLILDGADMYPSGVKARYQIPIEIGYRIACLLAPLGKNGVAKKEMLQIMVKEPRITPAELNRIQAKTLVMAGTKDMIKESHTRLIAASIPGASLTFLEGGHGQSTQNPEDFERIVLEFLKD